MGVSAFSDTGVLPQFAAVSATTSGASTVVGAVPNRTVRVLAVNVIASTGVGVKWQSHVAPTDLTGLAALAANGGYILPYNPIGWFQTLVGEALDVNLSATATVGGHLTYVLL